MPVPPLYFYREFSVPRKLHRYRPEYHQQHGHKYIPDCSRAVNSEGYQQTESYNKSCCDKAGFKIFLIRNIVSCILFTGRYFVSSTIFLTFLVSGSVKVAYFDA